MGPFTRPASPSTPRTAPRATHALCTGLVLVALAPLPRALADDPAPAAAAAVPVDASAASYETEVDAALLEYARGNFGEAREHFVRAHARRPSARTLRGLGKVEFELRHYVEARRYLGAALDASVNPLDPALRDEVERLLARANTYIAELEVQLTPPAATLELDGIPAPAGTVLSLVVGDHVLDAAAPGFVPERQLLRLAGGEQRRLAIALTELRPAAPASAPAPAPARDAPHGLSRRAIILWSVAAAVVVAGAVGAGVGVATQRSHGSQTLTGGSTGLVLVSR